MTQNTEARLQTTDFVFDDVIPLRPALVKRMGGDLEGAAIVARIQYRCRAQRSQHDGYQWWKCTFEELVKEIGISVPRLKRKMKSLEEDKWLIAKIDNDNAWDRTKSYRPNDDVKPSVFAAHTQSTESHYAADQQKQDVSAARAHSTESNYAECGIVLSNNAESNYLLLPKEVLKKDLKNVADDEQPGTVALVAADLSDATSRAVNPRVDVEQLCAHLASWIVKNGSKPPTITETWRRAARLLLDKDGPDGAGVPLDKALALVDWSQTSDFWKPNIRSMKKFRDQYDTLRLQALADWKAKNEPAARPTALVNVNGAKISPRNVELMERIAAAREVESVRNAASPPALEGDYAWLNETIPAARRELEGVAR